MQGSHRVSGLLGSRKAEVFSLDPESAAWTDRIIDEHNQSNVPSSDGMVRPSLTLLGRNLFYNVFRDWVAEEVDRMGDGPRRLNGMPKRSQSSQTNILLLSEFPWNYTYVDTTRPSVPSTIRCTYFDRSIGSWRTISDYESLARAFVIHVHGTLDPKAIGRHPTVPYDYFPIKSVTEIIEVRDDPRGVAKLVRATSNIAKNEIIGMYEGQWCLQLEHEVKTYSVLDRYYSEYKLFDCMDLEFAHHISPKLASAAGVGTHSRLRRSENNTVSSQVWLDGAYSKGYYEWATELNDFRSNPFNRLEDETIQKTADVEIIDVRIMGWPYKFVVSSKAIPKGKEILIDYGSDYWTLIGESKRNLDFCTKALQPLESSIPKLICALPLLQTSLAGLSKDLQQNLESLGTQSQALGASTELRSTIAGLSKLVVGATTMLAPLFVLVDQAGSRDKSLVRGIPASASYKIAQSIAEDLFQRPQNQKSSITKFLDAIEKMVAVIEQVDDTMTADELAQISASYDCAEAANVDKFYSRVAALGDCAQIMNPPGNLTAAETNAFTLHSLSSNDNADISSLCSQVTDFARLDEIVISQTREKLFNYEGGARLKLFIEDINPPTNTGYIYSTLSNAGDSTFTALFESKLAVSKTSAEDSGLPKVCNSESDFSDCEEAMSEEELEFQEAHPVAASSSVSSRTDGNFPRITSPTEEESKDTSASKKMISGSSQNQQLGFSLQQDAVHDKAESDLVRQSGCSSKLGANGQTASTMSGGKLHSAQNLPTSVRSMASKAPSTEYVKSSGIVSFDRSKGTVDAVPENTRTAITLRDDKNYPSGKLPNNSSRSLPTSSSASTGVRILPVIDLTLDDSEDEDIARAHFYRVNHSRRVSGSHSRHTPHKRSNRNTGGVSSLLNSLAKKQRTSMGGAAPERFAD
ncbi:hypothetical protein DFJ73DRAFT_833670 [Zopfochytrium polystomum]|nr:hypothetical protein DFJ73DRAFT_833670 [Zopfochytrium polystomum]